jgi:hypothetical protein
MPELWKQLLPLRTAKKVITQMKRGSRDSVCAFRFTKSFPITSRIRNKICPSYLVPESGSYHSLFREDAGFIFNEFLSSAARLTYSQLFCIHKHTEKINLYIALFKLHLPFTWDAKSSTPLFSCKEPFSYFPPISLHGLVIITVRRLRLWARSSWFPCVHNKL